MRHAGDRRLIWMVRLSHISEDENFRIAEIGKDLQRKRIYPQDIIRIQRELDKSLKRVYHDRAETEIPVNEHNEEIRAQKGCETPFVTLGDLILVLVPNVISIGSQSVHRICAQHTIIGTRDLSARRSIEVTKLLKGKKISLTADFGLRVVAPTDM